MIRKIQLGSLFFIFFWYFVVQMKLVDSFFIPSPVTIFGVLIDQIWTGSIIRDLSYTVGRILLAFTLSILVGLPLGMWLGVSRSRYQQFEFLIDFFRSIPSLAIFPLFLLIFGLYDSSKIFAAAFASGLVIVFNIAHGIFHASKFRILALKMMGATTWQLFRYVLFWESLPQTFIGLRSAVSISLVVIVASEMFIGTQYGLGRRVVDAQLIYEIPSMYAAIFLTGVIGFSLNLLLHQIEKKLLHWIV